MDEPDGYATDVVEGGDDPPPQSQRDPEYLNELAVTAFRRHDLKRGQEAQTGVPVRVSRVKKRGGRAIPLSLRRLMPANAEGRYWGPVASLRTTAAPSGVSKPEPPGTATKTVPKTESVVETQVSESGESECCVQ